MKGLINISSFTEILNEHPSHQFGFLVVILLATKKYIMK